MGSSKAPWATALTFLMLLSACAPAATVPAAATAVSAASAAPAASAAAAPKLEKPVLKIGLPVAATSFLPIYMAAAKTYKDEGLTVEIVTFRGDSEVVQALAADSIDVAVASMNGLINLITAGQPVMGFYGGFYQADFAWVGGAGVKTWADLKGKSIGVSTFGSLTDFLTRYSLKKNGLVPEKDVQIIQAGGSPTAYQALVAGRLGGAILSPPFKWQAEEQGLSWIGTQAKDVSPEWPKHVFYAKTKFIEANPNTLRAILRAHVKAIRLAKTDRAVAVQVMADTLKYEKKYAERAYDEVIPGFNERGILPERSMPTFWEITVASGDVKEPWLESRFLDRRFIDTFDQWAPK